MKFEFDRSFKQKINDDFWELYLITEEEANELDEKLNGDDDGGFRALTLTGEDGRCIFFVEGNVTKAVVTHELIHLFVSYFHLDSANITVEQFEEIIAEFFEANLDKFIKTRNKLYNNLKKLEQTGK